MKVCIFKVYDIKKYDMARLTHPEYDYNENLTIKNLAESHNMTFKRESSRSVGNYLVETGIYKGAKEDAWKFINDVNDNCKSHYADTMEYLT